jgi:hydrogenase nickel incorporation protein HypB
MCDTCDCGSNNATVTIRKPGQVYGPPPAASRTVQVEIDVLAKNAEISAHNRTFFESKRILALNLVSSPGSGKTTILERTIRDMAGRIPMAVIEGDQQTLRDAERIGATGIEVVQINTGTGCHLDGEMIHGALHQLTLEPDSILFIENVGNLVCPALFDLGEAAKVVIISTTEGEDKPQKYPHMFRAASLCLINKTDLLPYLDFDVAACREFAREVNPELEFIEMSATRGTGMAQWYAWLLSREPVGDPAGTHRLP